MKSLDDLLAESPELQKAFRVRSIYSIPVKLHWTTQLCECVVNGMWLVSVVLGMTAIVFVLLVTMGDAPLLNVFGLCAMFGGLLLLMVPAALVAARAKSIAHLEVYPSYIRLIRIKEAPFNTLYVLPTNVWCPATVASFELVNRPLPKSELEANPQLQIYFRIQIRWYRWLPFRLLPHLPFYDDVSDKFLLTMISALQQNTKSVPNKVLTAA